MLETRNMLRSDPPRQSGLAKSKLIGEDLHSIGVTSNQFSDSRQEMENAHLEICTALTDSTPPIMNCTGLLES